MHWYVLIPPVSVIILALTTRRIYLSLATGIILGILILKGLSFEAVSYTGKLLLSILSSPSKLFVLAFCVLVGSLIGVISQAGGVEGFVRKVKEQGIADRKRAQLLAYLIGIFVFIETTISSLIVGTASRPVFDRLRISREKLAYICDVTAAPVCMLIPFNAWGAYIIGLLEAQGIKDGVRVLAAAVPLNFYALLILIFTAFLILTGRDWSTMAAAERRAMEEGKVLRDGAKPLMGLQNWSSAAADASIMLVPTVILLATMPFALIVTGGGDPLKGSGSASVLISVSLSLIVASLMALKKGYFDLRLLLRTVAKGGAGMVPVTILMLLAFLFGDVSNHLRVGEYVAGLTASRAPFQFFPAFLFIASSFVAFSTGTSWGTYAVMVPIAVAMVKAGGGFLALCLAAVLGGGIFGDHASPVSDTTIISSMAAACDLMDHVQTQLPYALACAFVSVFLYVAAGFLL